MVVFEANVVEALGKQLDIHRTPENVSGAESDEMVVGERTSWCV